MHALICKARGENLWGHTPEQHSTTAACEESAPLSTSPMTSPQSLPLCLRAQLSLRGPAVERRALSLPERSLALMPRFPRAGNTHSTAGHNVWASAWQHLAGTNPRPQVPSSVPSFRNKNENSVVHNRDPFRDYFAKFLCKQNNYGNTEKPAHTTNSFFPYSHFHCSVQGAAGLKNRQKNSPLEGAGLWKLQCL